MHSPALNRRGLQPGCHRSAVARRVPCRCASAAAAPVESEAACSTSPACAHGTKQSTPSRRAALLGAACMLPLAAQPDHAWAAVQEASGFTASTSGLQQERPQAPDTRITHKVYLDIGIAPTALKPAAERTLGDKSSIPLEDAQPTGRIVLGLYGNHVPVTVSNFLTLVRSGVLEGTVFSRVLPGEYIQAGQQGQLKMGQVEPPPELKANTEVFSPGAFALGHGRPGTLSLSLSENDDDTRVKGRPGYKSMEFLITTGPGPVPRLDGLNIPFGRVLEGMGVVGAITNVPTFRANERTSALNLLAGQLGDDRAAGVRRKYGRPLTAVIILKAGELPLEQEAA